MAINDNTHKNASWVASKHWLVDKRPDRSWSVSGRRWGLYFVMNFKLAAAMHPCTDTPFGQNQRSSVTTRPFGPNIKHLLEMNTTKLVTTLSTRPTRTGHKVSQRL